MRVYVFTLRIKVKHVNGDINVCLLGFVSYVRFL